MATITPMPYQANSEVYFSRLAHLPFACWLDSGKPQSNYGRYDILSALPAIRLVTESPITQITEFHYSFHLDQSVSIHSHNQQQSTDDPLQLLQQQIDRLSHTKDNPIPFIGGAIGYLSYQLGRDLLELNPNPSKKHFPDMQMSLYHWALVQDHQLQTAWLVSLPECSPEIIQAIYRLLEQDKATEAFPSLTIKQLAATISRDQYLSQLEKIHQYILAGDCYQVNFAQCFEGNYSGHPYSAYKILRRVMASPFSAYLSLGEQAVMSLSPERFLQVKNRQVLTQPIKGTAPRNGKPQNDQLQAIELMNSDKNRAENLMIVDLLRNDLGHHCIPGSIKVDKLYELQSFPNVHHLVSNIVGCLRQASTSIDLLRDCFPGGSITGAPKKRAMEIIDELEAGAREIYCGSIGYINNNGDMDTNIAIRTVSCDGSQLSCWAGGGIVVDSDPEQEYQESLNKIKLILDSLKATG